MGSPIMTNLYYGTVKQILERVSSVMIDREAIQHLVGYVMEVILLVINQLYNKTCLNLKLKTFHFMLANETHHILFIAGAEKRRNIK